MKPKTRYQPGDLVWVTTGMSTGDRLTMLENVSGTNNWNNPSPLAKFNHSDYAGCLVTISEVNYFNSDTCAYYSILEDNGHNHWFDNCFTGRGRDCAVDIEQGSLMEVLGFG